MDIFFADNLKLILNQRRERQNVFASKMGVSATTVSGWINGVSYPNFEMLIKICLYLDISLDRLVFHPLGLDPNHTNHTEHAEHIPDLETRIAALEIRVAALEGSPEQKK